MLQEVVRISASTTKELLALGVVLHAVSANRFSLRGAQRAGSLANGLRGRIHPEDRKLLSQSMNAHIQAGKAPVSA